MKVRISRSKSKEKVQKDQTQKLQQIRSNLLLAIYEKNNNKSIQANYRSKANKIYKEKLKKVFNPPQMQQYKDILNYECFFQQSLNQSAKIKDLNENNEVYTTQTVQEMSRKDIYQTLLTLDADKLCQLLCMRSSGPPQLQNIEELQNKVKSIKKLPRIMKRNLSYKRQFSQSPSLLNPSFTRNQSQSPQSPYKRNRISSPNKNTDLSKSSPGRKKTTNRHESYFNEQRIIDRLNQINKSSLTQSNFRMNLQVWKDYLTKRHGNEIISTYYDFPEVINAKIVADTFNTIIHSNERQRLILAFLTFDVNRDGFICEGDLFKISEIIESSQTINEDIFKMIQFCKQPSYQLPTQSDLPKQLCQNPKRKLYFRLFEKQKLQNSERKKLPQVKNRTQHFIMEYPDSQRQRLSYTKKREESKNVFRINFRMFEQIFSKEKCNFIRDLLTLLLTHDIHIKHFQNRLRRASTLNEPAYRAHSLYVRKLSQNQSKDTLKSIGGKSIGKSQNQRKKLKNEDKKINFRYIRSNTDAPLFLQNQIKYQNHESKLLDYADSQVYREKTLEKNLSNDERQYSLGKNSQFSKLKPLRRSEIPQDLRYKMSVFFTDQEYLQRAHRAFHSPIL